jgi:ATP-dependent DNA helicase RecQ
LAVPPDPQVLLETLRARFGHDAFRGRQEEVIGHVLAGRSALVLFPTGEGKSLCYQLPALLLPGLTVVLSPLIALMQDQVAALRARGLPATFINSTLPRAEREARLQAALRGEVKLLFATPERFRVPGFAEAIRTAQVSLLAVDEAHCISHWGHDFRPDYARVGEIRGLLGDPPTLALTATATPQVQQDILRILRAPDAAVVSTGIERRNLFLSVAEAAGDEGKLARILERLHTVGGPGIVYFALIKDLLRFEGELRRRGFGPLVYHGDLSASERRSLHHAFSQSPDALMLATNAFGMGVDKPDIRFILHHQLPRNLEAYYQEIGRAGRDGRGSLCELLFFVEDIAIQRDFAEWANPGRDMLAALVRILEEHQGRFGNLDRESLSAMLLTRNRRDGRIDTCLSLLETAGCVRGSLDRGNFELLRVPTPEEQAAWIDPDKRQRDLQQLLAMVQYARSETCWKSVIHQHFGFGPLPGGCGACARCVPEAEWLALELPPALRRPVRAAARDTGLTRGDWIAIEGFGNAQVLSVEQRGARARVQVEFAESLERRRFDLDRIQWRRLS